ncbi:MAG: DUF3883 domain-containing protein [Nitrososphaerota archaeon]|jgi:hypothetical protein|nr:DUF3883 domain-containing protein [Nitrososphaerota archaeon]
MVPRRLDEVNYLVLRLSEFTGDAGLSVKKPELVGITKQLFAGEPINLPTAVDDAAKLSLIELNSDSVKLTGLGIEFARLNRSHDFEINEAQAQLLYKSATPGPLVALLVGGSGMSEEELEVQLKEKRIYGGRAEEFVLAWERERLNRAGMARESTLAKRISQTDVTRGYDIESFTLAGEKPDRFIEVKCTKSPILRFFWSKNEVDKAKELGLKYFIYFVWLGEGGEPEGDPEIIENPVKNVLENPARFLVSTGTLIVREVRSETNG